MAVTEQSLGATDPPAQGSGAGPWYYLGPEATFTHSAVVALAPDAVHPVPLASVDEVYAAVAAAGSEAHGVVPIENSVEGYVTPSLDALVASESIVAIEDVTVDITFNAYSTDPPVPVREVVSHPHALAQCRQYIESLGVPAVSTTSTAAACRDLVPGQIAIASPMAGERYGLVAVAHGVEDFHGARTRFLHLVHRDRAADLLATRADEPAKTMLVITPQQIGPGVLARLAHAFGARGVNMSSLVTRPLKAQENRYTFIVTVDGAPWDAGIKAVLAELLAASDGVKTLGCMPRRGELSLDVDSTKLPLGSVDDTSSPAEQERMLLW